MNRWCIVLLVAVGGCTEDAVLEVRHTLAVGGQHGCVVDVDDALRCWGDPVWPSPLEWEGVDGFDYAVPVLDVPSGVADVAVGAGWVCALARTGVILCWGAKEYELDFLTHDDRTDAIVANVGEPFVDVAVGWAHVCGATQGGDVWCWGENGDGQLGQDHANEIDGEPPPMLHAIELPAPAVEVAAGGRRSCARTTDGDVYCWGDGAASPTRVELSAGVLQISVGAHHACAVDEDGALYCWGDATITSPSGSDGSIDDVGPTPIVFERPVVQTSAGSEHSCARLQGGATHCWGKNDVGQSGLGRVLAVDENPFTQPPIDAGGLIASIAAGAGPRTCALLKTGVVRCWGHVERWDGTTDADCMVDVPNPSAGLTCEPDTIAEFSCSAGARCCLGDDETPADALPVPL